MRTIQLVSVLFSVLIFVQSEPLEGDIIVAKDDSGHFFTIQEALNSAQNESTVPVRIYIKSGEYFEKLIIPAEKTHIHFIGAEKNTTVINFDDYSGKIVSEGVNRTTGTSYTVLVRGNDFYAQDITFLNSAGTIAQAVALHVVADRVIINNCNIIANQDTLYPTIESDRPSRQYYKDCYIEGTTDFIFGAATALFDNSVIMSLKNYYITVASTPELNRYGFVFKSCSLLANQDATSVYLGRPWRPWARTVFIHTIMESHNHPAGWHNWDNPANEETAFYAEYMTHGVNVTQRVSWSNQLTEDEADLYTIENIFEGANGPWTPNASTKLAGYLLLYVTTIFVTILAARYM